MGSLFSVLSALSVLSCEGEHIRRSLYFVDVHDSSVTGQEEEASYLQIDIYVTALAAVSTGSYQRDHHTVIQLSFEPYIATRNWKLETEHWNGSNNQGTSLPFHDKLTAREAKRSEYLLPNHRQHDR